MKVRIKALASVLSLVVDAPNSSVARSLILQWILDEADRTGGNKHRIRRNLIWSNHVRGSNATSAFASLVWNAAANRQHDPLVATVRPGTDEQDLRDHLASLHRPLTSAEWVAVQVAEHDLDRRLTKMLLKRSAMEFNELRSLVGLWLARWGHDGTFDDVLAAEGEVKIGALYNFLRGKIRNHHFRRGAEPLERLRGALTEHETKMSRETGSNYRTAGSTHIDSEAPSAVLVRGRDSEIRDSEIIGFQFVDTGESAEDALIRVSEHADLMQFCRDQVVVNHGAAADRFSRIFERMAKGQTVHEIAEQEDVSEGRAVKLTYEIRSGLREAQVNRETARQILKMIEDEPFSTRQEIGEDLAIEATIVNDCLNLLINGGAISEVGGESYVLTKNLNS